MTYQNYLYFIYIKDSSGKLFYKVGFSRDIKKRMKAFRTNIPFDIYIDRVFFVKDMKYEKKVHKILKNFHVAGEWFSGENLQFELEKIYDNLILFNYDINLLNIAGSTQDHTHTV